LRGAPGIEITVEQRQSGITESHKGDLLYKLLPAGTYEVKLREEGAMVHSQLLTVEPGRKKTIDLLKRSKGRVQSRILKTLGLDVKSGLADFSESLGPIANRDLSLWLSLFGASRIIAPPGRFRKLKTLPLESFEDVEEGDSPVYVLAGFGKTKGPFRINL